MENLESKPHVKAQNVCGSYNEMSEYIVLVFSLGYKASFSSSASFHWQYSSLLASKTRVRLLYGISWNSKATSTIVWVLEMHKRNAQGDLESKIIYPETDVDVFWKLGLETRHCSVMEIRWYEKVELYPD